MSRYKSDRRLLLPVSLFGAACFACGASLAGAVIAWSKNADLDRQQVEIADLRERSRILEDHFRPDPAAARQAAEEDAAPPAAKSAKAQDAPPDAISTGPTMQETIAATLSLLERPRPLPAPGPASAPTPATSAPSERKAAERPTERQAGREPARQQITAAAAAPVAPAKVAPPQSPAPAPTAPPPKPVVPTTTTATAPPVTSAGPAVAPATQAAPSKVVDKVAPVAIVPGADPANKIEAVPASKAGVARLESGTVVMLSGKRVRVGEKFESGETLLAVEPEIGKIVTNARTLMLL